MLYHHVISFINVNIAISTSFHDKCVSGIHHAVTHSLMVLHKYQIHTIMQLSIHA